MSRTTMPMSMWVSPIAFLSLVAAARSARSDELLDLTGVEVLVGPADHAVAHVADETDLHVPGDAVGPRDMDGVLLHEPAFEDAHSTFFEPRLGQRLHPLLQHGEVVGPRLVQTVVAVPDHRFGGVARLERLVVLLLDGVEEAVAELEGLPVLLHFGPPIHAANFDESMYSSMRVILPSL